MTVFGANGIEMDMSDDNGRRIMDYQNGTDRLASRSKFAETNSFEARSGVNFKNRANKAEQELLEKAEQEEKEFSSEEKQEKEESNRIQSAEIRRRKNRRIPSLGSPSEDGSAARVSPIVASAIGLASDDDVLGNRPSASSGSIE